MAVIKVSDTSNSSRLRSGNDRFARPAPPEHDAPPAPAPKNDFFERFDATNIVSRDNGIDRTLHVVPDVRYIVRFMVFNIMKLYPTVEHKLQSLVTPATLMAYCLYQLYGFMLLCDYLGSPNPSFYASDFMDASRREHLFESIRSSYVMPFMLTVLHALCDCEDPRRPGLKYFSTLAGSRFLTDFGRIIPPQLFNIMHNISCNEDTNRNVGQAMTTLLGSTIWNTETNASPITVGHYLGSTTHANRYASWFYNTIQTLFSPVTGRDLLRRSNLQDIPAFVDTIHTQHNPGNARLTNIYSMFLNGNSNAGNTANFIAQMSNYIKADFDGKFQLGAVPDDLSGVQILVHGYSIPALPTWLKCRNAAAATAPENDEQFATRINWLQDHPYVADATIALPTTQGANFRRNLYRHTDQDHDQAQEPDTFIQFDTDLHISPPVHFLDPYSEGSAPVAYASLSGMIIENFEFDGTSVPAPNPLSGLFHDNNHFLQGSLPLSRIQSGLATDSNTRAIQRSPHRANTQKISHDLFNMGQNRLGFFDRTVSNPAAQLLNYGFSIVAAVRNTVLGFTKLSFRASNPDDANLPDGHTYTVWSPYRFIANDHMSAPADTNVFMLFNFRAMYGTSVPLTRSRHPNTTLPLQ